MTRNGQNLLGFKQGLDFADILRAGLVADENVFRRGHDGKILHAGLDRLFPSGEAGNDLQRLGALFAVLRRFSVISGGPGTGKTFTVAKVLMLLQEQARAAGRAWLRVQLLTPTGKAAQRLRETIRENLERAECDPEIRAQIPTDASTIHRALGYQPRTPTRFRHDARNPLPVDVVVVDEASMVGLALMAKLVDAVRPEARLILLGDKDQLASVEVGAILGDIYGGRTGTGVSREFAKRVLDLTGDALPDSKEHPDPGLHDCMVHLEHSWRFPASSGIGALARAVNAGDADAALAAIHAHRELELHALDAEALEREVGRLAVEKFGDLGSAPVEKKLDLLDRFRFLCAHREGPGGVATLNRWVEAALRRAGRIDASGAWYAGRPVIVTENDYQVELFNGDVGVIAPSGDDAGGTHDAPPALVAHFRTAEPGKLRQLSPGRLPPHDTVFAMSVHKAQGSELAEVALVLPPEVSPVLTRELVYTAITRARERVRIYGSEKVLRAAIAVPVQRASGLREALWGR